MVTVHFNSFQPNSFNIRKNAPDHLPLPFKNISHDNKDQKNLPAWLGRDLVYFGKQKSIVNKPEIKDEDVNFVHWKQDPDTPFKLPVSLAQNCTLKNNETVTLGTGSSSMLKLDGYPEVSPDHLTLITEDNNLYVIDNHSEKGTCIIKNTDTSPETIALKPSIKYQLHPGDKLILAGSLTFDIINSHKLSNQNIELGLPPATKEAIDQSNTFSHTHRISEPILDGYRDGGRFAQNWDNNGLPLNELTREVIIVDRKRDPILRQTIESFKEILKRYPDIEENARLDLLNKYVVKLLSNIGDTEKYSHNGMLLGEIINSGCGICRHRALLCKVLGDEIGLDIAIVRGRFMKGPHLWNEVILNNGKLRLLDPMHYEVVEKYISSSYTDLDGNRIY